MPQDEDKSDRSVLLRQYELYVHSMDRVSTRRHTTNTFFLALNTFLFSVLGILSATGLQNLQLGWIFFVSSAGITLCYCWYRLVKSYKGLNTAKFTIIHREYHGVRLVDHHSVLTAHHAIELLSSRPVRRKRKKSSTHE